MLQISKVSKSFSKGNKERITVLDDISFIINKNDFIVLLGVSGVGKSTILRMISGEIKPDKGNIFYENKNITKKPEYMRARFISKISQLRENNLPGTLTIAEVLLLAKASNRNILSFLNSNDRKTEISILLKEFKSELIDHLDEQVKVLSGGEHQIISLLTAFQLIKDSKTENKLLLLDEHVSNLDINAAKMVMDATNKLIIENSLTALMVTHNLEIAANYGNRVIILKDQKIAYDKSFKPNEMKNIEEFFGIIYNMNSSLQV